MPKIFLKILSSLKRPCITCNYDIFWYFFLFSIFPIFSQTKYIRFLSSLNFRFGFDVFFLTESLYSFYHISVITTIFYNFNFDIFLFHVFQNVFEPICYFFVFQNSVWAPSIIYVFIILCNINLHFFKVGIFLISIVSFSVGFKHSPSYFNYKFF